MPRVLGQPQLTERGSRCGLTRVLEQGERFGAGVVSSAQK